MHRFAQIRPWHWLVVAAALLAMIALISTTLGTHVAVRPGAVQPRKGQP